MTDLQRKLLPSREQIVAAIYETVLRPELFDRFCLAQNASSFIGEKPFAGGLNPVFEAPELQAHFARALEILEQQWEQMNRPNPIRIWADPPSLGLEEKAAQQEGRWILVTPEGRLVQRRDHSAPVALTNEATTQELLSWLADARAADDTWQRFVERMASRDFSWQDILVLETLSPNNKLLCRPIWLGKGEGGDDLPLAISVELLEISWPVCCNDFIAETFGLGLSETRALRALALGQQRDISQLPEWARIAAKAGAPGIAELVRLVSLLLKERVSDLAISRGETLPLSMQIRDREGRKTQCFRLGAETGQPVIFIHGMMDGIAGVQQLQPLLRNGGFRVYAPMRGGYGGSKPAPEKHQQLEACLAQIDALIEQENLRRPILLGHRSGVIFARAAALRFRERIGGLVGVAPTAPLQQTRRLRKLHRNHRLLALCARFAPGLAPVVLSAWCRSIQRQGAAALVRSQARSGSKGGKQIEEMELDNLLSLSLSLMMQQAGAGVLADLSMTPEDWREQMIGHAGQTVYLCGEEDALVRRQGLYPQIVAAERVQLRMCSGAGDVLLYVAPDLVLAALADMSLDRVGQFAQT